MRRWVAIRLLATVILAALPVGGHAETRGLLIGVSHYRSPVVADLTGPANDLPAIAALLKSLGATDLTILSDAAASRTSIEDELQRVGKRSKPGDWLVLYYSGHGAQAARDTGGSSEPDQFILLSGFDPDKQNPDSFVVDKDFYTWLRRYVPSDVRVLMVMDSCHSGTMHRTVDPRLMGFTSRLGFKSSGERAFRLMERPGPRLPALNDSVSTDAADRRELPNLVYIGASQDDELALETELPRAGSPQRGVLSYALEEGLSAPGADPQALAADADVDGAVTVIELAAYLGGQVRMLSAQRQRSAAEFADEMSGAALFSAKPRSFSTAPELPFSVAEIGLQDVVTTDVRRPWRTASSPNDADFQWIIGSGEVLRRSGDLVATGIHDDAAMSSLIGKWTMVNLLRPLVSESGMLLTLDPRSDDAVYDEGSHVSVGLSSSRPRLRRNKAQYAIVFNVAANGTIQLLYPLAGDGEGLVAPGKDMTILESEVVGPFGTDHVVAVSTLGKPGTLLNLLRTMDGRRAASGLANQIVEVLRQSNGAGSVAILEIYTAPRE